MIRGKWRRASVKSPRVRLFLLRTRKVSRIVRRPDYLSALRHGVLAATEHEDSGLRTDAGTVLDVGASRGQFALFARRRWPQASIICFEPIPGAAEKLRETLGPSVTVHRTALGSQKGESILNLSRSDDSSSLLPIGRQADEFPGTAAVGTTPVRVGVLSEYLDADLPRPIVLKIDVQGFELEVLRGAGDRLTHLDEVLCECSFVELYEGQALASDVVAFMHQHAFTLAGLSGLTYSETGQLLQADLLFRSR